MGPPNPCQACLLSRLLVIYVSASCVIWKLQRSLNIGPETRLEEAAKVINEFAMEEIKSRQGQEKKIENDGGKNQD